MPLFAKCFVPSVLAAHCAPGFEAAMDMLTAHATMAAPFGVTLYDQQLAHARPQRQTSDAFHAFIGSNEHGRQTFFYCLTRKTRMQRGSKLGTLQAQLGGHLVFHRSDEDAVDALLSMPAYETTILCVATSVVCMGLMRRALTVYAASLAADQPFLEEHCAALLASLTTVETRTFVPFRRPASQCDASYDFVVVDADSDLPTLQLPCVLVSGVVLCLPVPAAHAWERLPSPATVPPSPSWPSPLTPRSDDGSPLRFDSMPKAARPRLPKWVCPTCAASSPSVADAPAPSHWCPCCRKCNVCVGGSLAPARAPITCALPDRVVDLRSLLQFPCASPLPHQDVDLSILLSRLDSRNVILVIIAIMSHHPVLFISEDLGILADAIEGVLALLHPFKSEKNVVPIGFKTLPTHDILEGIVPVVMGTTPAFLLSQDEAMLSSSASIERRSSSLHSTQPRHILEAVSIMGSPADIGTPSQAAASPQVLHASPASRSPPEASPNFFRRAMQLVHRLSGSSKAEATPSSVPATPPPALSGARKLRQQSAVGPFSPGRVGSARRARREHGTGSREASHNDGLQGVCDSKETPDERATRLLSKYADAVSDNVVVVDLDTNAVSPLATGLDVQLPPRLLHRIFDGIMRHGNMYSVLHPEYQQPDPELPRSATAQERQRMQACFNQVRQHVSELLDLAHAARARAGTMTDLPDSMSPAITSPTLSSLPSHMMSPQPHTPVSRHSDAATFGSSPMIGTATPAYGVSPATMNALNSDEDVSDPMSGLVLTSVSERFPWTHTATQAQLLSQQYVNPVQLSNDELQDPPTAVQALHNRIAIAPIIMRRQLSYNAVFTSDPDSVCRAMGMNFDRVRLAMLSVMVSLFRSYRMYIRADASQAMQAVRSASDEVMTASVLPLSAQLVSEQQLQSPANNEPEDSAVQIESSEPRRRRPAPPSFSQLFAIEEFLAEQTHDESRTLLRYCVNTFMPFSVFIDERCTGHDGADLFDRMCFDSMRTRADVYDRIMRRKLDSELLVLVNTSMPRFTIDALRVPAHCTTMHASLWAWKPVCVLNKGSSSDLRITSPSAAFEDTREEYLYASFAHRSGYGDYALVEELQARTKTELDACAAVTVTLDFHLNTVTCPGQSSFPPAGPLNVFEVCFAPSVLHPEAYRIVFASESPALRLDWILQLKSRLRSPRYIDTLRELYLAGGGV